MSALCTPRALIGLDFSKGAVRCLKCCTDLTKRHRPRFITTTLSLARSQIATRSKYHLTSSLASYGKQNSLSGRNGFGHNLGQVMKVSHSSQQHMQTCDVGFYQEQVDKRLVVLGKSALCSCLTEHFLELYPNLSALKIAYLVSHVTKEILPFKLDLDAEQDMSKKRAKMYAKFGSYFTEEGRDLVLNEIKKRFGDKFSSSEIEMYSKLADPASLLRQIAEEKSMQLELRKTGWKTVAVYINESMVAEATASSLVKAEYEACLSIIKEEYMGDIAMIHQEDVEGTLARDFQGNFDGQRVVELSKCSHGSFGLFLKGGEKATIQTEKFWEYNYIEPVFINKIADGSPAALSGRFQEGDIILAVGDFTLSGATLKTAVSMINQEDHVTLTVKFDPEIKLRDKIKSEFIEREKRAFKETLKSDQWRKWHEANAEKNPEKYLKMK